MSFESFTGVLAAVMGVAMALSPLLQARRVRQVGDSSEVSIAFFVVFMTGSVAWIARGVATTDPVILVPNTIALVAQTLTLLVVLRYRPRPVAAA
jgi:uncharacterized protein with PQ loop repeat